MFSTRTMGWMMSLILLVGPLVAMAATPAVVERAKRATALVEIEVDGKGKAYGSAFCIDATGIFVTNAHVSYSAQNGTVTLVVEPGEKTQRLVTAKVLRTDKEKDLAILQVAGGGAFQSLQIGKVDGLSETMGVIAFGYPFGEALSSNKKEYPSVSVNTGKISSLRKVEGELESIQIDAAVNPGNSGGPILDDTGDVIGIVQKGVKGTGVNFAIPVTTLRQILNKPLVVVSPTTLPYAARSLEQAVNVRIISAETPTPKYELELTLRGGEKGDQKISGTTSNGLCTLKVHPVATSMDEQAVSSVEYEVSVKLKDKPTGVATGWIRFDGAPSGAVALGSSGTQLWSYVHAEVEAKHQKRTSSHGGSFTSKVPFEDVPPDGAVLVGFNYGIGKFIDSMVDSLQPIYLTAEGETVGPTCGTQILQKNALRAKDGYAVTAVEIRAGGIMDGFRVIYTRFEHGAFDLSDTYKSEFIGNPTGGSLKTISTEGQLAVGIFGTKEEGGKIGTLGLITLPLPAAASEHGWSLTFVSRHHGPATAPPAVAALSDGKPFESFAQMLEVLSPELQPSGPKWAAGRTVGPEWTDQLKGKQAHLAGEFGSSREVEVGGKKLIEVSLDCGFENHHGFRFVGKLVVKFPGEQAKKIDTWQIHDKINFKGTIEQAVVRGSRIDTICIWLKDAEETE